MCFHNTNLNIILWKKPKLFCSRQQFYSYCKNNVTWQQSVFIDNDYINALPVLSFTQFRLIPDLYFVSLYFETRFCCAFLQEQASIKTEISLLWMCTFFFFFLNHKHESIMYKSKVNLRYQNKLQFLIRIHRLFRTEIENVLLFYVVAWQGKFCYRNR